MGRMLSRLSAPGTMAQVRHVSPVRPGAARGLVADVYAQVGRDFGMLAPPVILHSPAPRVLAACWLMLRESLLASGQTSRAAKEVVAAEVSAANACPYCVDVHAATLRALTGPGDAGLGPLAEWARASGLRETAVLRQPPPDAAELVAVAVTFQYLNRMVHVFLGDSPLPPQVPRRARGSAMRLFGAIMRPAARRAQVPGGSLGLLPAAPPPADLAWADGVPHVAGAFARAAAAIEEGGRRSVPEPVRDLVAARVHAWDGRTPGLGRGWVAEAVAGLPAAQRPAARLALLTALAAYQVDRQVVDDFLLTGADERALVEVTAWASLSAARKVGSWLPVIPAAIK